MKVSSSLLSCGRWFKDFLHHHVRSFLIKITNILLLEIILFEHLRFHKEHDYFNNCYSILKNRTQNYRLRRRSHSKSPSHHVLVPCAVFYSYLFLVVCVKEDKRIKLTIIQHLLIKYVTLCLFFNLPDKKKRIKKKVFTWRSGKVMVLPGDKPCPHWVSVENSWHFNVIV